MAKGEHRVGYQQAIFNPSPGAREGDRGRQLVHARQNLTPKRALAAYRMSPSLIALLTASDFECTWSFSYALRT